MILGPNTWAVENFQKEPGRCRVKLRKPDYNKISRFGYGMCLRLGGTRYSIVLCDIRLSASPPLYSLENDEPESVPLQFILVVFRINL